jgi:hypothetical protein
MLSPDQYIWWYLNDNLKQFRTSLHIAFLIPHIINFARTYLLQVACEIFWLKIIDGSVHHAQGNVQVPTNRSKMVLSIMLMAICSSQETGQTRTNVQRKQWICGSVIKFRFLFYCPGEQRSLVLLCLLCPSVCLRAKLFSKSDI